MSIVKRYATEDYVTSAIAESQQTSIINGPLTFTWDYNNLQDVSFEIEALGMSFHKVSDVVLPRDQIFSASWQLLDVDGVNYGSTEEGRGTVELETDDFIFFYIPVVDDTPNQFWREAMYVCTYNSGDIPVEVSAGVYLTINVPESGLYQVCNIGEVLSDFWATGSVGYIAEQTVNFVQPDWNQDDTTKPDYIRNKPDAPIVDGYLNANSENAIQNKAVAQAVNEFTTILNEQVFPQLLPELRANQDNYFIVRANASGTDYELVNIASDMYIQTWVRPYLLQWNVQDSDEGKVMQVVNGQWVLADPLGNFGHSMAGFANRLDSFQYRYEQMQANILPAVTAADNGKILKVVNGVWKAVDPEDEN